MRILLILFLLTACTEAQRTDLYIIDKCAYHNCW